MSADTPPIRNNHAARMLSEGVRAQDPDPESLAGKLSERVGADPSLRIVGPSLIEHLRKKYRVNLINFIDPNMTQAYMQKCIGEAGVIDYLATLIEDEKPATMKKD